MKPRFKAETIPSEFVGLLALALKAASYWVQAFELM
jgi:hypothetical protein